jgi:hypothetical protein
VGVGVNKKRKKERKKSKEGAFLSYQLVACARAIAALLKSANALERRLALLRSNVSPPWISRADSVALSPSRRARCFFYILAHT